MDQAEQEKLTADTLAAAQKRPANVKTEKWNPMEDIPTVSVGKEITNGMTLSGYFVETQRLCSTKFIHSQEKDPTSGLPVQYRHVLKLADGKKLAIWNTGELKTTFEKLAQGEFISLTYKGKGKNAKGQDQHFFEYERGAVSH